MDKYDLIIVGAGPAGIFTAVELLRHGSRDKILLVEKGKPVEQRRCPKAQLGYCVNCRPTCAITTGFSGAGAFSDGKLSLSYEVGGDLPTLIGADFAQKLIDYTDKIYLEFGADPHVEGIYTGEEIREIRKNAIKAGLKLVDCPIRHLGTEKAHQLYQAVEEHLQAAGVEMLFSTECENILLEDDVCRGVIVREAGGQTRTLYADTVVIGTGRRGADWLEKLCAEHHIAHKPGTVDIGVRVECRNEVMEKVNRVLYESKLIGYPRPWKNKVRTFCQNPGGFVAQENILVSHNFTEPFNQPIAYAQKVGELTNMLGAGRIMVQRYGDILDGKRTWPEELARSNVRPRHHRRHALPGHDQHHRVHQDAGHGGARLCRLRDPAVQPRAEVLFQQGQNGPEPGHQHPRPALPGRQLGLDPRPDDGQRDGRADGPQAGRKRRADPAGPVTLPRKKRPRRSRWNGPGGGASSACRQSATL